jgi:hypothetical protein
MLRMRLIGLSTILLLIAVFIAGAGILFPPPSQMEGIAPVAANADKVQLEYMRNQQTVAIRNGEAFEIADNVQLALNVVPDSLMDFTVNVDLYLTTASGDSLDNAQFSLNFDMLDMNHGWDQSPVDNLGDGHYQTVIPFFMYGRWAIDTYVRLHPGEDWLEVPTVIEVLPADGVEDSKT